MNKKTFYSLNEINFKLKLKTRPNSVAWELRKSSPRKSSTIGLKNSSTHQIDSIVYKNNVKPHKHVNNKSNSHNTNANLKSSISNGFTSINANDVSSPLTGFKDFMPLPNNNNAHSTNRNKKIKNHLLNGYDEDDEDYDDDADDDYDFNELYLNDENDSKFERYIFN